MSVGDRHTLPKTKPPKQKTTRPLIEVEGAAFPESHSLTHTYYAHSSCTLSSLLRR